MVSSVSKSRGKQVTPSEFGLMAQPGRDASTGNMSTGWAFCTDMRHFSFCCLRAWVDLEYIGRYGGSNVYMEIMNGLETSAFLLTNVVGLFYFILP